MDSKNAAGWAVPARGARRIHAPAPAEAGHHERAEYGMPEIFQNSFILIILFYLNIFQLDVFVILNSVISIYC